MNGVFQYSAGVAAEPGFEIVRARFAKVLPIKKGFERIEAHLAGLGRPIFAFVRANCVRRVPSMMPAFLRSTKATSNRCDGGASSGTT
jgi:hypothetical protein